MIQAYKCVLQEQDCCGLSCAEQTQQSQLRKYASQTCGANRMCWSLPFLDRRRPCRTHGSSDECLSAMQV